jgi:WD40 repeat protein/serine/threonine protein kinase
MTHGGRNPVEALAEEFLDRLRRGEPASPEEYAAAHPELAEEIHAVFPALMMMEDLGGDAASRTGSLASGAKAVAGAAVGRLGEFRLLRELGRGGMGVVYEAEQESLGRRVALKVLPAGALSDSRQVRRFEREARSAARLHHTHIVPVFGVGQHEGTHFYVMQLIQGQGLDAVLLELKALRHARAAAPSRVASGARADRPVAAAEIARSLATGRFAPDLGDGEPLPGTATLPWSAPGSQPRPPVPSPSVSGLSSLSGAADASALSQTDRRFALGVARIGLQVAEALAYAHGQGVLHRDIKPSNLLLDRDGNVWVADFGLAKAAGAEDLTHTGDVVGTLRYMAPERFRGEGDARADIYALGLTLYELLALRPAYGEADRTKLIHQVTQEEPPRLRRLNGKVPADLETIVHKAMAREPGQRYATAGAVAEDLRRFLEGRPIRARRVSTSERAWRWCKRNKAVAGLIAGIALALVVGTAVSTYFAIRATRGEWQARANEAKALAYAQRVDREVQRANQAAQRAHLAAERARDAKLLSDRRLYQAEISLAQQAWRDGQLDLVRSHLEALVPQRSEDPDLRGFEWYYLHRIVQSHLILRGGLSVAYSPDGRTLVSGGQDGTVRVWETATGRELHTLRGHAHVVYAVAFSPDGRTLASGGEDQTVWLWEAATGRALRVLRGHTDHVHGVAFSPDGRTLASAANDRTVRLWDITTGRELLTLRGHAQWVNGVAYSPDGRVVASAGEEGAVRVWDTATGQAVRILPGHSGVIKRVVFSPDGKTLAAAEGEGTVQVWDLATGRGLLTLRGHSQWVNGVAYSPDGRTLVSTGFDRTVRLWDAATGRELRTLRGLTADARSVAYSPDGRHIAAAAVDESIMLWDLSADREAIILGGHADVVTGVAYSPDGRTLVSTGSDRTVRLWDAASGQEIRTLLGHTSIVWGAAFSPDGRTLASAGWDHSVRLWDAATGRELRNLSGHTAKVLTVAYAPDGRTLASAGVDRTVRVWDVVTGRELRILRGHADQVNGVAYSPDGRTLASAGSDRTVRLWDAATGEEVQVLRGHPDRVLGIGYGPDGRTLAAVVEDGSVTLWDAEAGQTVWTLHGRSVQVRSVSFNPDGRTLASAGSDGTVKLWDAATGRELLTLRGHSGPVLRVAFSPDGRTLASTGFDCSVRVWDATPLTPQAQAIRQARLAVQSLFDQARPIPEVLDRIRRDLTLDPAARAYALDLARANAEVRLAHEAERLVEALYAQALFRPEVLARLRADATLSQPMRDQALALAEHVAENPESLAQAGRAVVRRADAEPSAYRLALQQAEAACRLIPDEADFLTALGMAYYRLGRDPEAVAALERADRLHREYWNGQSSPADLAFLALARHRCGDAEQARALLGHLRETMKNPLWARDGRLQNHLHEAEVIELDFVFPADPFAP